jgi:glycolate dehydrogenase FAD-binding subunit
MAHGAIGASRYMTSIAIDPVDALRERVREAWASATPLRIAGHGTWLDAGRPVAARETITTLDCTGIVDYVPDDLTLTARAGTTLDEIRIATTRRGQWLALDPFGSGQGSLGATLATNSAGPLSAAFGQPRDLALGLAFVTGAGVLARGGGRVVKNVAGFDLTRLMIGAWGTLGLIAEATVRLHARPDADVTIAVPLDDAPEEIERVRRLLRRLPFTPYACEVVNGSLATSLLQRDGAAAIVRLGGNSESARAQRAAFAELGTVGEADPALWESLRAAEPPNAMVVRLSRLPSEIARTWRDAVSIASVCPGTLLHASPARGVVRCIVPNGDGAAESLRRTLAAMECTRIGERLPPTVWNVWPAPAADALSAGVRSAFDAKQVLNPGIMGELA